MKTFLLFFVLALPFSSASYSSRTTCVCLNFTTACSSWSCNSDISEDVKCFDGASLVEKKNFGLVSLKSLQIGDEVRTGQNEYSLVYAFLDRVPNEQTEMLKLCTPNSCLTVSKDHLLFPNRFAGDFKIGDEIETVRGLEKLISIERVKSKDGYFAPATLTGTIVVNDFVASCYAMTTWHTLAHAMFWPLRLWSRFGESNRDSTGMHPYARALYRVSGMSSVSSVSSSNSNSHSNGNADQRVLGMIKDDIQHFLVE